LVAGTDCGERQQAGIINSDDGYQAANSPDWLAGPDPLLSLAFALQRSAMGHIAVIQPGNLSDSSAA